MKASIRLDAPVIAREKARTEFRAYLLEKFKDHTGDQAHVDCDQCKLLKHLLWWLKTDKVQVAYSCVCGVETPARFQEVTWSHPVHCPRCGSLMEGRDVNG